MIDAFLMACDRALCPGDPACATSVFLSVTLDQDQHDPLLRLGAPRGRRLVAKVPHGHWKTATLLVALRNDRRASVDTSTGATITHCGAREGNTEYTLIDS